MDLVNYMSNFDDFSQEELRLTMSFIFKSLTINTNKLSSNEQHFITSILSMYNMSVSDVEYQINNKTVNDLLTDITILPKKKILNITVLTIYIMMTRGFDDIKTSIINILCQTCGKSYNEVISIVKGLVRDA